MTTGEVLFPPGNTAVATKQRLRRSYRDLLVISFLILFFELSCIRFFGSMVVFLTFFTNIVLMACFLGMSVGCLIACRKKNFIDWVLPLTFIAVCAAFYILYLYEQFSEVTVDVGNQSTSPQLIYFGTEYRSKDLTQFVVHMWVVGGVFFVLIAMMFVGLGQVMGRAFDEIPNRIGAYTTNIFGSIVGIAAFFVASWFWTSPLLWFFVSGAICLHFVRPLIRPQVVSLVGVLIVVGFASYSPSKAISLFWSPYYKIQYAPQLRHINTNNISHQMMADVQNNAPAYMLPHLLNRDAGFAPFHKALIIGAGSGNDVAASIANNTGRIDAVEIDPLINKLGMQNHPNRPFQDSRVRVWYDDGRSFLHKGHGPYDLVVYALVDSLVLHSGFSSLRLENFLFTEQAFRDIKSQIEPGGVFAMYNFYRQGWVITRLKEMAERVFGVAPVVISLPYQSAIGPANVQGDNFTFILVGTPDEGGTTNKRIASIRQKFAQGNFFWLNADHATNERLNGFAPSAGQRKPFDATAAGASSITPSEGGSDSAQKIGPAHVDTTEVTIVPTDNWPFLYLKNQAIPWAPNGQGLIMILILSIFVLLFFTWPLWFDNQRTQRIVPDGRMFFLGAGFMLLETKGVVHMALLFGSTWVVNSVVFVSILVMILLANLFVMAMKPGNLIPFYLLLIAALLVNTLVPMDKFLALANPWRAIISCSIIFVPIFFAGIIFAASFRDTKNPDIAIGSNIAGVILGGLSESLSMMLGFNYLLGVAVAYYAFSGIFKIEGASRARKQSPVAG
jgi:hypothetical protein